MNISFRVDDSAFLAALGEFQDQLPFAMQKSINDTMVQAQTKTIAHANDVFTIRRQTFLKQSMKIEKFAKKNDLEAIFAVRPVGKNTESVFAKFETGQDKRSKTGGKIAVPTDKIRPDASRVITTGKRPRNLKKAFKGTLKSGNQAIMQVKGRGKRKTIQVSYILKTQVPIDNRLRFVKTATDSIQMNFNANADRNIALAISTARLKP